MTLVDDRGVERLRCVEMQVKRAGRSLENPFQVRITG
jgi:hypothetical protein